MTSKKLLQRLTTLIFACVFTSLSAAHIRVGQTTGVTGAVAGVVKESNAGIMLAIDACNAKGGIGGQKVELITLDDKFDPNLTLENARILVEEKKVSLLFGTRGTPHNLKLLPLIKEQRIALLAPMTGAMALRTPVNPYIFNVRTPYKFEVEKVVELLSSIRIVHLGILRVNDSFGEDALMGLKTAFPVGHPSPSFVEVFDRQKPDFREFISQVKKTQPEAVLIIGSGTNVVGAIKELRASGSKARVVTLANNASDDFIKALGPDATGIIVSQVTPNERRLSDPLVREATDLAKAKGINNLTPAIFEGYIAGKVLIEALVRAGPSPSREQIRKALESISSLSLGDSMTISYSATGHSGTRFTELSIIDRRGRFIR